MKKFAWMNGVKWLYNSRLEICHPYGNPGNSSGLAQTNGPGH